MNKKIYNDIIIGKMPKSVWNYAWCASTKKNYSLTKSIKSGVRMLKIPFKDDFINVYFDGGILKIQCPSFKEIHLNDRVKIIETLCSIGEITVKKKGIGPVEKEIINTCNKIKEDLDKKIKNYSKYAQNPKTEPFLKKLYEKRSIHLKKIQILNQLLHEYYSGTLINCLYCLTAYYQKLGGED